MSVLDFVEMSILECVILCAVSFFISVCFSSIGRLFLKQEGIILQSVVGMSVVAAVVLVSISYNAFFAKYVIFAGIVLSIILTAIYIIKQKPSIKKTIEACLPALVLYVFVLIKFLIWIVPENGFLKFNCHMTSYSDIPIEIFKADYYSRIKILDVFPYEYGKYHMFNGCMSAIPLAIFPLKSYVTYIFAKYVTISLYFGAIFEKVRAKNTSKNAILSFAIGLGSCFVLAFNLTTWSPFVNNYSTLLFMGILWLLMSDRNYKASCVVSLIFAVSAAWEILPGAFLFLFSLYMLFVENQKSVKMLFRNNLSVAICCLIIGIGVIITPLSGKSIGAESVISGDFMSSAFSGWNNTLPTGGWIHSHVLGFNNVMYGPHMEYLIIPVFLYLLLRQRTKIWGWIIQHWIVAVAVFLIIIDAFAAYVFRNYGTFAFTKADVKILMFQIVLMYILPMISVLVNIDNHLKFPFYLFLLASLLIGIMLNNETTACNWSKIFAIVIIIFVESIMADVEKLKLKAVKLLPYGLAAFGLIYVLIYDFHYPFWGSLGDGHYVEIPLEKVEYTSEVFQYNSAEDASLARLNAFKGNRVHYNVPFDLEDEAQWKTSISMRMAVESDEDQ